MHILFRLLPILALGLGAITPAGGAFAMCGGNVLATCKPRVATVQPAAAEKSASSARRRKKPIAPILKR